MKVAIIADQHFGVRNDNSIILQHQIKFINEILFPTIQKNNISTLIHLGDLCDRRKYTNHFTLNTMREKFLDLLSVLCNRVIMITGNHDIPFKQSSEISSLNEFTRQYSNFEIYNNPTEITLDGLKILLLPWICDQNRQASYDKINTTSAEICMGHLEIQGFEFHSGSVCEHGMDSANLSRFDMVLSGHFHKKSSSKNIHYLGSTNFFTWNDWDCTRGFHVFDTRTRELTYIQNKNEIFHKIIYDDENKTIDQVLSYNFEFFRNGYVKILVQNKTNPYWLNLLIEQIERVAINVKVLDAIPTLQQNPEIKNQSIDNTIDVLRKVVQDMDTQVDKKKLENLMVDIHSESLLKEV